MATSRPRYTVSVDDDLFRKIEDFRYSHRYKNRADATVALSSADDVASLHHDPGDPAFREEIVRYPITQMRELEPDAYNRVFYGAPLEDAIAQSLAYGPDNIVTSDPPAGQNFVDCGYYVI